MKKKKPYNMNSIYVSKGGKEVWIPEQLETSSLSIYTVQLSTMGIYSHNTGLTWMTMDNQLMIQQCCVSALQQPALAQAK